MSYCVVLTYDDLPGEDESSASHDSAAFNKVARGLPNVGMVKPALTSDEDAKKFDEPKPCKGNCNFLKFVCGHYPKAGAGVMINLFGS